MHVPVAIVGAGPSGSLLAWILRQRGIESIVLERRSRAHVEGRIRAGVMENNAVELMVRAGVGERLKKECMYHPGVALGLHNEHHFLDFERLIGIGVTVYGQSEVTKDLLSALESEGHALHFEAEVTQIDDLDSDRPRVTYVQDGKVTEFTADFVVGADGFHGPSRKAIPAHKVRTYEKTYPFGWLGVMVEAPPSKDVALFSHHERGFALLSMRSPDVSRLYLQCAPDEDIAEWSDARIWDELDTRLGASGWTLQRGKIFQKDVTPLRSFFTLPMAYERLFLVGDAAHIVPPTGAKGLNAAFADVSVLSAALIRQFAHDDGSILGRYGDIALARNLQCQRFSNANTVKYHVHPDSTPFDRRMQIAELEFLTQDETAQISYARQHTGLPFAYWPEL